MTRKPKNFDWLGFTSEQVKLLDFIDFIGNNAWSRNEQSEKLMPDLLADCEACGLSFDRVSEAMRSIGYSSRALHQLARWESKRNTGKFGR